MLRKLIFRNKAARQDHAIDKEALAAVCNAVPKNQPITQYAAFNG